MTMGSFIPVQDNKRSSAKKRAVPKNNKFSANQFELFNIGISETIKRRKAESYAHVLLPSGYLEANSDFHQVYDPFFVDDPDLKMSKHRTVITLPGFMGSILQYSRPVDIKKELNEHFRTTHPNVDSSLTLSQIRKIKTKLLEVGQAANLELASVATAYVYFEKLALKGVVSKFNRRLVAAACLLLASKVTDTKGTEMRPLLEHLDNILETSSKDVLAQEFNTYAALEFSLFVSPNEVLPHLERILAHLDMDKEDVYSTKVFYMGVN